MYSHDERQGEAKQPFFFVRLIGAFGLTRADGTIVRIAHLRNRALLVLLLTAPGQERTRRWLEAQLWSERPAKEAGQSLRTALSALRKALLPHGDVLRADRTSVSLAPGVFSVDLMARRPTFSDPDILEGLDIRDDAFEAWLTLYRREQDVRRTDEGNTSAPGTKPRAGPPVVARPDANASRHENYIAQLLIDLVDQNLTETIGTGVVQLPLPKHSLREGLVLRSSVVEKSQSARMALRLEDPVSGRRIWSWRSEVPSGAEDLATHREVLQMGFGASTAILDAIRAQEDGGNSAEALLSRAIAEMFTFDPAKLHLAEGLLTLADADLPSAIVSAWRALLLQFMTAESRGCDAIQAARQAHEECEYAIAEAPDNAQVLAIASVVKLLLGSEPIEGRVLAERAIFLNPSNAFGYVGLGIALLRDDRASDARLVFRRAEHMAAQSHFVHWIEMFQCLAAIAVEDFDFARRRAVASAARAPNFRSPLRHLYALNLFEENHEAARTVLARLHRIEPGFSMDMIRANAAYPAATIRNSRLIEAQDAG